MQNRPSTILEQARGRQVLCVGDLMLDRYVYGKVDRISPEAPVPVLRKTQTSEMPGGAGNVARNMAAMGLNVVMVGCVGDDEAGQKLETLLDGHPGIETRLARTSAIETVIKSRFVANNQQLLRVDTEAEVADMGPVVAILVEAITRAATGCAAIIVSDYAKGCITSVIFRTCVEAARANGVPLLVDPKSLDLSFYSGATLIKPNAQELAGATGLSTSSDVDVETALRQAAKAVKGSKIVVTRAGKGMSWIAEGEIHHKRGEARQVFDVSGAGDTSMAALALGLATGSPLEDAVSLAVTASGLAVGKTGTATVDADEIRRSFMADDDDVSAPILDRLAMADRVRLWKASGLRVGFTNGCFDILHPGHLSLLQAARARCDRLIVAVNSDASVRRLKGNTRPVNCEADRAALLAGLNAVDGVTSFTEDTPAALIGELLPDLLVKGGDYSEDTIIGADTVRASGGDVLIVPLVEGQSTSAIIERSKT